MLKLLKRPTRNTYLVELYEKGETYQAIADRVGLTRQRVFQIVGKRVAPNGYMLVAEAAPVMGACLATVIKRIQSGELKAIRRGNLWYVVPVIRLCPCGHPVASARNIYCSADCRSSADMASHKRAGWRRFKGGDASERPRVV